MLKNCWGPNPDWSDIEVVVLDFDLSWHVDAEEISIAQPQTTNGYLAPEQLSRRLDVSTRNASVDSFGLGMTLYFVRTCVDPSPSQHMHAKWQSTLTGAAHNYPCSDWKSLPIRYFCLIYHATRDAQRDRWDVANLQGEIEQLQETLVSPHSVKSAELLAEELAARTFGVEYVWDYDNLTAVHKIPGIEIRVTGNEIGKSVAVLFRWNGRDIRRWQERIQTQMKSHLTRSGFEVTVHNQTGEIYINAETATESLVQNLDRCAAAIEAMKSATTMA